MLAGMPRRSAGPPSDTPIGLLLAQTAKIVSRAFDDALTAAGGSTSTWLILLSLKTRQVDNQRALAELVGVQGATLTHHLDNLEKQGLVRRVSDPTNRRIQRVELTAAGDDLFLTLRNAAMAFDRRLRSRLDQEGEVAFRRLLRDIRSGLDG